VPIFSTLALCTMVRCRRRRIASRQAARDPLAAGPVMRRSETTTSGVTSSSPLPAHVASA